MKTNGFLKKPAGGSTSSAASSGGGGAAGGGGGWGAARLGFGRAALLGLGAAQVALYKAPRPAEFWPVTARNRLRFFLLGRKIKRNPKRTPKIPK